MSRLAGRIRTLQAGMRPGECHICGKGQRVCVWVDDEYPEYEWPMCDACGEPRLVMVWHMTGHGPMAPGTVPPEWLRYSKPLPRSEQPAAAFLGPSSSAAQSVAAPESIPDVRNSLPSQNIPAGRNISRPRVKRRRYSGE